MNHPRLHLCRPVARLLAVAIALAMTAASPTAAAAAAAPPASRPAALVVSIDGLRPDYLTDADAHGSKIPTFRALLAAGARGRARGVLPTATYPSHTSILTGVAPAAHGIVANHPFDPANKNPDAWYWYSQDVKAPTLWRAAADAGYVVGSVAWPVSVGADGPAYNIPEYADARGPTDLKMVLSLAGRPLMAELAKTAGPFITDVENTVPRDRARARYAAELIRQKHVRFMTLHLAATDHYQHRSGPFHKTVLSALEEIDAMIADLVAAIRAEDPGAYVCLVSDHGFAKTERSLRLDQAFVDAGLITLARPAKSVSDAGVADWVAVPWSAGGSAEVVLKDPDDPAAVAKVKAVLDGLAADPANGIESILDRPAIAKLGGSPRASFWVDMKPGTSIAGSLADKLVVGGRAVGTHGYLPTHPEMDALFLLAGPGVRAGADLGRVDMRAIAPTLAKSMNVPFPSAELPPLDVAAKGQ